MDNITVSAARGRIILDAAASGLSGAEAAEQAGGDVGVHVAARVFAAPGSARCPSIGNMLSRKHGRIF
jgi:hypothetical protein